MNALTLTPGSLTLKQLRNVWRQPVTLSLDESAHRAINDSVACVEAIVAEGRTAYGINTGFACWRRPVSPRTIWKIYNVRWCCRTPRASVSRWMMRLSV
jgi:histidine ammonia-lyase